MKYYILLLTTFLIITGNNISAQNPNFDWAVSMGGSTGNEFGMSIATDNSGDIYTVGSFQGSVDFDPGTGVSTLSSNGSSDIFIQKMDPNNNLIWVKKIGGSLSDGAEFVLSDGFGNIYITGKFQGSVDFDPGTGVSILTTNGSDDAFILKIDSSGNFVWVKSIESADQVIGFSIAIDNLNNVYYTGIFDGTADFDPGIGTMYVSSGSLYAYNCFIQKLDVNGNFLWAKTFGALNWDWGSSIKIDGFGNIYLFGHFEETVDFDPNSGTYFLTANAMDVFVLKLDGNSNFIWARSFGGSTTEWANSLTVDNSGNIYVTGWFLFSTDLNPGTGNSIYTSAGASDIFIKKYDTNGNFIWAKTIGGTGQDVANSIFTDNLGYLYLTGHFQGTVDLNPNGSVNSLTSIGSDDIFILKLDTGSNYIWSESIGGISSDKGFSILSNPIGDIYVTGVFSDVCDFDPGLNTTNLSSNGDYDVFILKLNPSSVGLNEIKNEAKIYIYPNPASSQLTIETEKEIDSISITDITGKLIKTITNRENTINVSDLSNGIYFLQIVTNEGSSIQKLIKQ